jgi:FlgD Ig-like domain/Cytochrome c554 and c-prime
MVRLARLALFCIALAVIVNPGVSQARNPFRNDFFGVYPNAEGTALDDVPSNKSHCGVCHFDFDGGGPRNPYGLGVQVRLAAGLSAEEAVLDMIADDSDSDGFSNQVELGSDGIFLNTPTFPGLKTSLLADVLNVDTADLIDFLTPSGSSDTTPPLVTVLSPSGGEVAEVHHLLSVNWAASDASGIVAVDIQISDDGGTTYRSLIEGIADLGTYDVMVPNLPGVDCRIKVIAYDAAYNPGEGISPAGFVVSPLTEGAVPTTLRDFDLAGTQPFQGGVLDDPSATCRSCHGDYDPAVEPWHNWQGSMMAQAMRDPLFIATMRIAEQDAPSSGDLCLRCHTPGGWQEGRSFDTAGGMLTEKDRQGVQCDYCHRMVDPHYDVATSPPADFNVLQNLDALPVDAANGQFVTDPDPVKRGPYADAAADHQFYQSDFTLSSNFCGTCHDVSNPAFVAGGEPGVYEVDALGVQHPDGDRRNMFPVERTYSEWSVSEYAGAGVYQPQFAGDKLDGIVSTCQDCHMRDVTGVGSNVPSSPTRTDLGIHDLTGGNTFVPDIIETFFPGSVDPVALQDGKSRAISMISLAATMDVTSAAIDGRPGVVVRVTNETGHKLPSGYPEGRRTWLNLKAFDAGEAQVYESGAYDPNTGVLTHDEDAKIYHIEPGVSSRLAALIGFPFGPSFHFVLNDTVFLDNRIPPRGFTNANFASVQSPPVGYEYEDGQYWDDTAYALPASARRVEVTLYYQSTSKEYIEFLRDENTTDTIGQELYDAWVAQGRAAPVVMAQQSVVLDASGAADSQSLPRVTSLAQNYPNPFNPVTRIEFTLPAAETVSLRIYDERGRLVRSLVDGSLMGAGPHTVVWSGQDDGARGVASGVYHYVLQTESHTLKKKMTLVR